MAKFIINQKIFDSKDILSVSLFHNAPRDFEVGFLIIFISGHREAVTYRHVEPGRYIVADMIKKWEEMGIIEKYKKVYDEVMAFWTENDKNPIPVLDQEILNLKP